MAGMERKVIPVVSLKLLSVVNIDITELNGGMWLCRTFYKNTLRNKILHPATNKEEQ